MLRQFSPAARYAAGHGTFQWSSGFEFTSPDIEILLFLEIPTLLYVTPITLLRRP